MTSKHLYISALLLSTASLPASAGTSIWNHNGSEMLLQSSGSSRIITYHNPRRGISARPGQLLFEGRRVGNRYSGTAYTFRSGCRPAPYRVSGRLTSETRIVLTGAAPKRSGCRVIGYTRNSGNSRLVFSYIRKAGGQYQQPSPAYEPDEGPREGPVETIIRNINGGQVIFKVQDQDDPVSKPIRIDATARCDNGRVIPIYNNHRTCQLDGINVSSDNSMIALFEKLYTGSGCFKNHTSSIDITNMCR